MQLPNNTDDKSPSRKNFSEGNPPPHATQQNAPDAEFSEFMWMANEDLEAFDQKVISELDEQLGIQSSSSIDEEEEFLHRMLEEEEERDTVYFNIATPPSKQQSGAITELNSKMQQMNVSDPQTWQSNLNPLAEEFVPGRGLQPSTFSCEASRHLLTNNTSMPLIPIYGHGPLPVDGHPHVPLDGGGLSSMYPGQPSFNTIKINHNDIAASIPMNNQIRPQMNSHGPPFYNGVPCYVPNVQVFAMNNSYIRHPATQHFQPNLENERCNEDEGYGDN